MKDILELILELIRRGTQRSEMDIIDSALPLRPRLK